MGKFCTQQQLKFPFDKPEGKLVVFLRGRNAQLLRRRLRCWKLMQPVRVQPDLIQSRSGSPLCKAVITGMPENREGFLMKMSAEEFGENGEVK